VGGIFGSFAIWFTKYDVVSSQAASIPFASHPPSLYDTLSKNPVFCPFPVCVPLQLERAITHFRSARVHPPFNAPQPIPPSQLPSSFGARWWTACRVHRARVAHGVLPVLLRRRRGSACADQGSEPSNSLRCSRNRGQRSVSGQFYG
jgi:hypothetical protein